MNTSRDVAPRRRGLRLAAVAVLLLGGIGLAFVLPRLVDAESYRGLLRSQLGQQLGRDVDFGKMELSLWPVLGLRLDDLTVGRKAGERFDKPIVADSLRVGARLAPLLRGRLDVTSLVVERPVLTLYRDAEGGWQPDLSVVETEDATTTERAATKEAPLLIEQLRVTDGRVLLHSERTGAQAQSELDGLTVDVAGLGGESPLTFSLSVSLEGGGNLRAEGSVRPSVPELSASLELGDTSATTLTSILAALVPTLELPADLLAERPLSASAQLDYNGGAPAQLTISNAALRGGGLRLARSTTGSWNYEKLLASEPAPPEQEEAPAIVIAFDELTIEDSLLSVEDLDAGVGATRVELAPLRVTLLRRSPDTATEIELDSTVVGRGNAKSGKLAVRGKVGPPSDDAAATPLELELTLTDLALDELRGLLPPVEGLDISKATLNADLQLAGDVARELNVDGRISLAGTRVTTSSPQGGSRTLGLDLNARGSLAMQERLGRIDLRKLDLEFPSAARSTMLTLRGTIDATSAPAQVDVELLRTRVAADDLAALVALFAPDAPLRFASPDPVELELRARGALGDGRIPDLQGQAKLSNFTFVLPGMSQQMENVAAEIGFSPDRVALDNLGGRIGKSDVTGSRVIVTRFDAPRITVDLRSSNADFWELFSFVEPDDPAAPASDGGALPGIEVEGTLRVERGSLQTLQFEKLDSTMAIKKGVLTLAPLEMDLFGGHFSGSLEQDLASGELKIQGDGAGIDADGFLAQNLELGGMLSGKMSAQLGVEVHPSDSDNLLLGVSGGGPLQLVDGRLARLHVLKSLSRVTGVFGESSLQRLTKQLAKEGTPFQRAETRLSFDEGTMAFEDLLLEMGDLTLAGRTALDTVSGKLSGRMAVAFSPTLSATMREEKSRAADLFWDPNAQQVRFGFSVSGQATAPSVQVDWESALRGAAERKLADQLRGLLAGKSGATSPTDAGASQTDAAVAAPDAVAAKPTEELSAADGGPAAAIDRARWSGPVLLRDLVLEVSVKGAAIEHASLTIVDARGVELKRTERIASLDEQLAALADRDVEATIPFQVKIDGKRFLTAKFPISATVTVHDREGRSVSATRSIDR